MRALLIDDYLPVLKALTGFLCKDAQVEVVGQALNGCDGLKLAEELQPDLVLVDFSMYGMDGIEVTQKLKAGPKPPRVIMLSFHTGLEYHSKALQAGADAYLAKSDIFKQLLPLLPRRFAQAG
jgi:DNA-binding NarL/FixJ family response regulator